MGGKDRSIVSSNGKISQLAFLTCSTRQGVGILFATHKTISALEDTNQDFLTRTLHALSTRLAGLFARFVDEQVRAIEDTKVKIKKRKGVIAFVRTFPHFSASIENMIPNHEEDMLDMRLEARNMVDDAYQKINRAMFESLRVIAKEGPAVTAGDPEDKEALNYHILLIENMNHYVEEVDDRNDVVLAEWRQRAMEEMNEHMALYVDAVVRRPLGKLMVIISALSKGSQLDNTDSCTNRNSSSRPNRFSRPSRQNRPLRALPRARPTLDPCSRNFSRSTMARRSAAVSTRSRNVLTSTSEMPTIPVLAAT